MIDCRPEFYASMKRPTRKLTDTGPAGRGGLSA